MNMEEYKLTNQDEYEIDLEKEHPEIQYLLYRNGVEEFPKRHLHIITGKAKSDNTFSACILIAALFGDTTIFESKMSDDEKVLYFNTEREYYDVVEVVRNIHEMLGWDPNDNNARLRAYYLRETPREKRYEFIRNRIEAVKPAAVFIDSIEDLIDMCPVEAKDIKERLSQLSIEFNCAICYTICTPEKFRHDEMIDLRVDD